jgi:uncharacterized protein YjiS (DUF1127 family)
MFIARTTPLARRPRPSLFRRVLTALALHRQRQHLRELDPHMLQDIGLTAAQARAEADQPFWHAPAHWVQHQL